ncbi:thermonuclease family protein [Patescibacteria group bacterium AH-259-L05]|nr:thermonuclease family protein [Patescibacteria group bacterium AH-259-L05]
MGRKIKQQLATFMLFLLAIITFVAMLAGGFALLGKKEWARGILEFFLVPLLALFGGTTVLYLGQDLIDTIPEVIEPAPIESEIVQDLESIIPSMYGFDDKRYFVNNVIDGDTIKVEGNVSVRLLGINAPDAGECYYNEARIVLAELIGGERVELRKDTKTEDDFGRWLRYVYLPSDDLLEDDIFVNEYMLRNGYARTFIKPPNDRYRDYFVSARERALKQETGLWGACDDFIREHEQETEKRREAHEPPADPNCIIKGNISQKGAGKVYFLPTCGTYSSTKIDTRKGEQYFCTEEEAQAAGFKKSGNCK